MHGPAIATAGGWAVEAGMKLLPVRGSRRTAAALVHAIPQWRTGDVVLTDMAGRNARRVPLRFLHDRYRPAVR